MLDPFYLAKSLNKGGVPLHRHSHCGVDTACEGDVDEGQEDGDGLEQGEVLRHDHHSQGGLLCVLPGLVRDEMPRYRQG